MKYLKFPILAGLAILASATSCQKITASIRENVTFSVKGIATQQSTKSIESSNVIALKAEDCEGLYLIITEVPYAPEHTDAATKGHITTTGNIASTYGQFTVDAFRQGEKYMDGVTVRHEDDQWNIITDGEPYVWPTKEDGSANDNLTFWAYTPSLNADIEDSFNITAAGEDSFAFSYAYRKDLAVPYTKDLLVSYKVQNSGEVDLTFSHALAAVSALIHEEQDPYIKILSCKFDGIYTSGDCVCTPAGETLSFAWTGSAKGGYESALGDGEDDLNRDNLHFAIPQILPEGAAVSITVNNRGVAATHSISLAGTEWKAGYRYIYTLRDDHELSATLPRGSLFWADVMNFVGAVSHSIDGAMPNDLFDDVVFKTNVMTEELEGRNYRKLRFTQNDVYCVFDKAERHLTICTPHKHLLANTDMSHLLDGNNGNTYADGMPFFFARTMDLRDLETQNTTSMDQAFISCGRMTEFKISEKFNTAEVTDMKNMFEECVSLEELDLSVFDTRKVTSMSKMFQNCYKLSTLILGENFVIPTKKADMMTGCGRDAANPVVYCTDETWNALSNDTGLAAKWIHKTLDQR